MNHKFNRLQQERVDCIITICKAQMALGRVPNTSHGKPIKQMEAFTQEVIGAKVLYSDEPIHRIAEVLTDDAVYMISIRGVTIPRRLVELEVSHTTKMKKR